MNAFVNKNFVILFIVTVVLFSIQGIRAQDGTVDFNFGNNGGVLTSINNYDNQAASSALQSDGKIIQAGKIRVVNNQGNYDNSISIVRYKTNGIIDSSFGTDGITTVDFGSSNDYVNDVAVQQDDKIIIFGTTDPDYETYGSYYPNLVIMRFNSDGSIDNTFGTNGKVELDYSPNDYTRYGERARSIEIEQSGKILLAGTMDISDTTPTQFLLIRLNTDGTVDNTFGTNGKVSYDLTGHSLEVNKVIELESGNILLAGSSYSSSLNHAGIFLARFNSAGIIDSTFANNGYSIEADGAEPYDLYCSTMGIQQSSKILIFGSWSNGYVLFRYNSDGSLDNSFAQNGMKYLGGGDYGVISRDMVIQSDDKIIIGGSASLNGNYFILIYRLTIDGNFDTTFGINQDGIAYAPAPAGFTSGNLYLNKLFISGNLLLAAGSIQTNKYNYYLGALNNTIVTPNQPPVLSQKIPDLSYREDTGPQMLSSDLYTNFNDPDGGNDLAFSTSFVSGDNNISLDMLNNGGTYELSSNSTLNDFGTAQFFVTAQDTGGLSVTDTVNITVTPVNDPPAINLPDTISIMEDESFSIALLDSTKDVDTPDSLLTFGVSYSISYTSFYAQIFGNTLTGSAGSSGQYWLTVTVTDDSSASGQDSMLVIVDKNNLPVLNLPDTLIVTTDQNFNIPLRDYASDVETPDTLLNFSFSYTNSSSFYVSMDSSTATLYGSGSTAGEYFIYVMVTDQNGGNASDTTMIIITNNPMPPVVTNPLPDTSFAEDTGPVLLLPNLYTNFNDPDGGNDLKFTAGFVSGDSAITAKIIQNGNIDSLLITSTLNEFGTAKLFISATDSNSLAVADTFSVTVTPVNDPPVINLPDTINVTAGVTYSLQLADIPDIPDTLRPVYDVDTPDSLLTFEIGYYPMDGNFTITYDADTYTISGEANNPGNYTVYVYVSDDSSANSMDSTLILVQNPTSVNDNFLNQIPKKYSLAQNYPNPFNPSTVIRYGIPNSGLVTLKIYNVLGREVATLINKYQQAGRYEISFNASELASGIYFYRLHSNNYTSIKKMILLK